MPVAWNSRQRGFTLIELLITLSVTTIGLIGLLSLHLSVTRGNDGASRAAEAEQVTASELESLRAMRLDNLMKALTGSTTVSFSPTPQRVQTINGRAGVSFTVTSTLTALTSASTSLMKIRVVTQWAEEGGRVGSNGGLLDHSLALEVVRTLEEAL